MAPGVARVCSNRGAQPAFFERERKRRCDGHYHHYSDRLWRAGCNRNHYCGHTPPRTEEVARVSRAGRRRGDAARITLADSNIPLRVHRYSGDECLRFSPRQRVRVSASLSSSQADANVSSAFGDSEYATGPAVDKKGLAQAVLTHVAE